MPADVGRAETRIEDAASLFADALLDGDLERCRQVTLSLFMNEYNISTICDRVIAGAFAEIGDRWACGEAEVYQERHGCELTVRVLGELRSLIPPPPEDAPIAIGGTSMGDHFSIPTLMAEVVLRQNRWNASSLGTHLPLESFGAAIERYRPQVFWLSCSHVETRDGFIEVYNTLYDTHGNGTAFVIGGQALDRSIRQQIRCTAHCETMGQLESFACALHARQTSGEFSADFNAPKQNISNTKPELTDYMGTSRRKPNGDYQQ
ncbi:MAG: B12-binding domain-containing protein [Pirellulales bacterium]